MLTYQNLTAESFAEQLSTSHDGVLLDVRSEREYLEKHLKGAINIPVTEKEELLRLDKARTYFVHCRVGGRSAVAAHLMIQEGFEHVYNLNDDIAKLYEYFSDDVPVR